MASCVTCGDELHPERAQKYDYCTKEGCRRRNARQLPIVAVGVNKASDQYVVLSERTRREIASGRYKKQPEAPSSWSRSPSRNARPASVVAPRSSAAPPRPRWSEVQEKLAVTYRALGMKPEEIAEKLGVTPYLVTQILLAASSRGER
jgi:hypothetical protein